MSDFRDHRHPRHGGDIDFATSRYGVPNGGWLDLSTGVNPHPYTAKVDLAALARLPDRSQLRALLDAARAAYGIPSSIALVATPGSEVAIRLLPLAIPGEVVAIVSPTYASHAEAWRAAGRIVRAVPTPADVAADATVAVVANPNNPDGRLFEPTALANLAARMAARSGLLIVDEAFVDVAPGASLAPRLDGRGAMVLRSFGKFFGLPGLRLGFVAGDAAVVARLEALLGDWPVSAPAIAIGAVALSDDAWQSAMRDRLGQDRGRLGALLDQHGLAVRGGTDLFVLVQHANAEDLHRRLAGHGIWARSFADWPTWLRLGLPPDDTAFARLDRALSRG
jgi:cobalamin biosynthesis protein CobC